MPVRLGDEATTTAETDVLRVDLIHCLDHREWDFEDFLRHGKGRFKNLYVGYGTLD